MRRLVPLALAAVLFGGCASTNLPPVTSPEFSFLPEEKNLWKRVEDEQKLLETSGLTYDDPALDRYLNDVAKKLCPPKARECIPFRVVVLDNPYSNAFAYPNGRVYVHTGMLALMDNEAQLATLLGHEMTHATHRHAIRERRGLKNKSAMLASLRATAGTVPFVGGLASTIGEIGTMAAVSGYSKDLETEADNVGLERMIAAGYEPKEAPKLFEHLLRASEGEAEEPFFFGSHPKLQDRLENYEDFLATRGTTRGGRVAREAFESKVAGAILASAELDLKAGRFSRAEQGARRFKEIRPRDGRGLFLLGEIYRQRNGEGDLDRAKEQFRQAVKVDAQLAEPYRSIGLLYLKEGQTAQAKANFQAYLNKAPRADDREFVKEYIRQCR